MRLNAIFYAYLQMSHPLNNTAVQYASGFQRNLHMWKECNFIDMPYHTGCMCRGSHKSAPSTFPSEALARLWPLRLWIWICWRGQATFLQRQRKRKCLKIAMQVHGRATWKGSRKKPAIFSVSSQTATQILKKTFQYGFKEEEQHAWQTILQRN